jgi:peptidoglycan/LPS O-acetylase OafA/YrhL
LGVAAFVLWIIACVVLQFVNAAPPWPEYMTRFINLLFAFGVGSALILQSYRLPAPWLILGSGALLFFGTGLVLDYGPDIPEWSSRALFGVGSALALLGAVELERSGRLRAPRVLSVLGAASFSIYLTHMIVLPILAKLAVRLGLTHWVPAPIAFVGLASLAIAAGVVVHFVVEARLVKTRRLLGLRQPVTAP